MTKRKLKKSVKRFMLVIIILLIVTVICSIIEYKVLSNRNMKPVEEHSDYYTLSDFGLVDISSDKDMNGNGIDDYTDMVNGAIKKAKNTTKYIGDYYAEGYPPDEEAVSSDILWSALMEAGYYLKDMMAQDIRDTYNEKVYNIETIDSNIDFRRINNIDIFLNRYATKLTNNCKNIKEFNKGDILIFDNGAHIAIVSNKININGIPYIIEINKIGDYEVNRLETMNITSHYRFDYSEKLQELINKI